MHNLFEKWQNIWKVDKKAIFRENIRMNLGTIFYENSSSSIFEEFEYLYRIQR